MKLSTDSKYELREKIIEELAKVPDGKKIHLDKDILEDLLFEVVTVDKENDIKVKLPIWSGEFLRKIDLSQVDFTDVSWAILDEQPEYRDITHIIRNLEAVDYINSIISRKKIKNQVNQTNGFIIDYSGTNANIDLTKSFEALHCGNVEFNSCNFSGLDFSKQDLSKLKSIELIVSNFENTGLRIPDDIYLLAYGSSLKGLDLSGRTIDAWSYLYDDDFDSLTKCDLTDTGIEINLDKENFSDLSPEEQDDLKKAIAEHWIGCYVNGKKIKSFEEVKANVEQITQEYDKMKNEIFNSVFNSIEEQINYMK